MRLDRDFTFNVLCTGNPEVIEYINGKILSEDEEIRFISEHKDDLVAISEKPEKFLDLGFDYFYHKDFIKVAVATVRRSLLAEIDKLETVDDSYVKAVKKLLDRINKKALTGIKAASKAEKKAARKKTDIRNTVKTFDCGLKF